MEKYKYSLILCFILLLSSCGPIKGSLNYSRSRNVWNGNVWNGNVLSTTIYDTIPATPSVTIWHDPITGASGVGLGVKVIDFKIKN